MARYVPMDEMGGCILLVSKKLQNGKIYVLANKLYLITVLALPVGAPRKRWGELVATSLG
jgi:hypothetical protein